MNTASLFEKIWTWNFLHGVSLFIPPVLTTSNINKLWRYCRLGDFGNLATLKSSHWPLLLVLPYNIRYIGLGTFVKLNSSIPMLVTVFFIETYYKKSYKLNCSYFLSASSKTTEKTPKNNPNTQKSNKTKTLGRRLQQKTEILRRTVMLKK